MSLIICLLLAVLRTTFGGTCIVICCCLGSYPLLGVLIIMIVRWMVYTTPDLGGKYSVHISFVVVPVSILRWLLVVLYSSL